MSRSDQPSFFPTLRPYRQIAIARLSNNGDVSHRPVANPLRNVSVRPMGITDVTALYSFADIVGEFFLRGFWQKRRESNRTTGPAERPCKPSFNANALQATRIRVEVARSAFHPLLLVWRSRPGLRGSTHTASRLRMFYTDTTGNTLKFPRQPNILEADF